MSCLYKIKKGFANYTNTETKLANYILENKDEVISISAKEFGDKVGASAAAVIRFSKKVGYKGFTELKMEIARDNEEDCSEIDDILRDNDTIEMLVKKTANYKNATIDEAYKLVNISYLKKAIEALRKARIIYLFGVGNSSIIAQDLAQKFSRINVMAIHQADSHVQLASSVGIGKEDAAIAISYRGNTREVNSAMRQAKENGAVTIGITQYNKNNLSKIVDIPLYIPSEEKDIRYGAISSRDSSFIITDLLYLGVAKYDFAKTKRHIMKTRELVLDTFR
ncbi:MurR/RpiR family transcriptional regulator [Clostridium polynesiense]|uniref:MurR/RpiR family transcriptional regulator n=1 Tax=Clostridium polynesiense TaxID=1325933 RepID=UPI00058F14E6|nr:MurR/RpiR family transcriptional regulator [Clostridium polynesiense]